MQKKSVKKILNIAFYVFLFLMSTYILLEWLAPNQTIKVIGVKPYVVVSPSMEPDIMVGDIVFIRPAEEADLAIGEVITFYAYLPAIGSVQLVTHYIADIIETDDETLIYKTQGANKAFDDVDQWRDEEGNPVDITMDDIVGELWFTLPFFGYAFFALRNPVMLGLILLNVAIVIAIIKYIKSGKKESFDDVA
ncbi:MAG: signal peptidase I [Acholeplasmataceae bacterium]